MPSYTCDYYPNCEICPNYNECELLKPIPNEAINTLIKWELEYMAEHNKEINLSHILEWYNKYYGVDIPFSTIKYLFHQVKC